MATSIASASRCWRKSSSKIDSIDAVLVAESKAFFGAEVLLVGIPTSRRLPEAKTSLAVVVVMLAGQAY